MVHSGGGFRSSAVARSLAWLAGFGLMTALLIGAARAVIPADKVSHDYVCYWAAGLNFVDGQNLYNVDAQARIQQSYGWDKNKLGLGLYDFLPFYYPPWFAMLCTIFVPLGYDGARVAWLVVNAELLLLTAYLLRNAVPGVPRVVPFAVVPVFVFSLAALIVGQTTILIFFLIVAAWRLTEGGWDRCGGAVLAWVTIKPQLTLVLIFAYLLWAVRQGRWGIVQGFATTLALLCVVSFALQPWWLTEMLLATRRTPPPTEYFPWIGTTWFLLLKGAGLRSLGLYAAYAAIALPFFTAVVRVAVDPTRPLRDVLSLSLLAAYFVAPYGRHYDFPVLLIPLLTLLGTRLPERWGTTLMAALLILPYAHYMVLGQLKIWLGLTGRLNPEFTFFWVPLLLAFAWFASRPNGMKKVVAEG